MAKPKPINRDPKIIIPTPHQQETLNKFQEIINTQNHKRFYFGFQAGKGKTYTSLLHFKNNNVPYFLVICDANLMQQWRESFYDIYGSDEMIILDNPKDEEKFINNPNGFYVCSYARVSKIASLIQQHNLNIQLNIIFDESQALKDFSTAISKSMLFLNKHINHLSLLSGSAISKDLSNLYVQFCLLLYTNPWFRKLNPKNPNKMISYYDWGYRYFNVETTKFSKYQITSPKPEMVDEMMYYLKSYAQFINTEFDGINKPKYINVFPTDPNQTFKPNYLWKTQKVILDDADKENIKFSLLDLPIKLATKTRTAMSGFVYASQLSKEMYDLVNNFYLNNPTGFIDPNQYTQNQQNIIQQLHNLKEDQIIKLHNFKQPLLERLLSTNDNYVIFYNFKQEKEDIKQIAQNMGYTSYFIDGKQNDLEEIKQKINSHKKSIVAIQYLAGARGIDGLQYDFHKCIHYSLTYSPEQYNQANARIYRMHQKNNVEVYHLIVSELELKILLSLKQSKKYNDLIFNKSIDEHSNESINLQQIQQSLFASKPKIIHHKKEDEYEH